MFANISRKAQKAKLSALSKEAFLEGIMTAAPRDYQDRNWFYHIASLAIGYPLQFVSILAGSYLLYEIAVFVWQIASFSQASYTVFAGCFAVFLLIEMLRRWLIDTTGYHYLATLRNENGRLTAGEFLQTKVYILALISAVLVTSGTIGAYQYSKNHAPQAQTVDIKRETSPLSQQVQGEKQSIAQLDKAIQTLQSSKAGELRDHKSYAVWEGKEYLLPETKTRHEGYDKQIATMQAQRQKHLELIQKYEQKLVSQEQKFEQKNQHITSTNESHKEVYAAACAGIWLVFEMILLLMLSYPWVYKMGIKREKLLEIMDMRRKNSPQTQAKEVKQPKTVQKNSPKTASAKKKAKAQDGFPPIFSNEMENEQESEKNAIGFDKWYEKEHAHEHKPRPDLIVERVEIPKETIVAEEGYKVVCAHCGKHEIKKRPAKYCSNICRKKHWQAQQELTHATK